MKVIKFIKFDTLRHDLLEVYRQFFKNFAILFDIECVVSNFSGAHSPKQIHLYLYFRIICLAEMVSLVVIRC